MRPYSLSRPVPSTGASSVSGGTANNPTSSISALPVSRRSSLQTPPHQSFPGSAPRAPFLPMSNNTAKSIASAASTISISSINSRTPAVPAGAALSNIAEDTVTSDVVLPSNIQTILERQVDFGRLANIGSNSSPAGAAKHTGHSRSVFSAGTVQDLLTAIRDKPRFSAAVEYSLRCLTRHALGSEVSALQIAENDELVTMLCHLLTNTTSTSTVTSRPNAPSLSPPPSHSIRQTHRNQSASAAICVSSHLSNSSHLTSPPANDSSRVSPLFSAASDQLTLTVFTVMKAVCRAPDICLVMCRKGVLLVLSSHMALFNSKSATIATVSSLWPLSPEAALLMCQCLVRCVVNASVASDLMALSSGRFLIHVGKLLAHCLSSEGVGGYHVGLMRELASTIAMILKSMARFLPSVCATLFDDASANSSGILQMALQPVLAASKKQNTYCHNMCDTNGVLSACMDATTTNSAYTALQFWHELFTEAVTPSLTTVISIQAISSTPQRIASLFLSQLVTRAPPMMLHALAQSLADLPRLCDPLQAETVAVKSIGVENSISWKQPAVIVATSVLLVMDQIQPQQTRTLDNTFSDLVAYLDKQNDIILGQHTLDQAALFCAQRWVCERWLLKRQDLLEMLLCAAESLWQDTTSDRSQVQRCCSSLLLLLARILQSISGETPERVAFFRDSGRRLTRLLALLLDAESLVQQPLKNAVDVSCMPSLYTCTLVTNAVALMAMTMVQSHSTINDDAMVSNEAFATATTVLQKLSSTIYPTNKVNKAGIVLTSAECTEIELVELSPSLAPTPLAVQYESVELDTAAFSALSFVHYFVQVALPRLKAYTVDLDVVSIPVPAQGLLVSRAPRAMAGVPLQALRLERTTEEVSVGVYGSAVLVTREDGHVAGARVLASAKLDRSFVDPLANSGSTAIAYSYGGSGVGARARLPTHAELMTESVSDQYEMAEGQAEVLMRPNRVEMFEIDAAKVTSGKYDYICGTSGVTGGASALTQSLLTAGTVKHIHVGPPPPPSRRQPGQKAITCVEVVAAQALSLVTAMISAASAEEFIGMLSDGVFDTVFATVTPHLISAPSLRAHGLRVLHQLLCVETAQDTALTWLSAAQHGTGVAMLQDWLLLHQQQQAFDGESWDDLQTRDADRLLQNDLRSCLARYTAGVSRFRRTTTGVSGSRNAAVSPQDVNLICDDYYVIPPPPPPRVIDFKEASCGCCGVM